MLIRRLFLLPGLTGTSEWAAGVSGEVDTDNPFQETEVPSSEGWSTIQKAFLFFVVIAAVGFYVRWTQQRDERDEVGYEKTMA